MWPQWMPTCGLTCARACPTAACKNFLSCGKGPSDGDDDSTPRQYCMDKGDVLRRHCNIGSSTSRYSATAPRFRVAASQRHTGDDYVKGWWHALSVNSVDASVAGGMKHGHSAVVRGRTFGKPVFDDEELLFETRPASVDVISRGKLLEPHEEVSWPGWDSPKKCASPRDRSPVRNCRLSTASTSAGALSPRRSSMASRSSLASSQADEPAEPVEAKALLTSFPLPTGISAWDWPLSRHEKKTLVLMLDRQELIAQRNYLAHQLAKAREETL